MDKKLSIMVVDDEMIIRESFSQWFAKAGHRVETAASGIQALAKLKKLPFDLLFVDIKMPEMNGIDLLERIKQEYPQTFVIIITAYGSINTAVKAMKLGASDYLLKPFKPEQLQLAMEKIVQQKRLTGEIEYLKGRLDTASRFDNIVGKSRSMIRVFDLIAEVADSDASVLLSGETGTGKELVAKAIHAKSNRNIHPFIAINCGAMPDTLLESELFGHQKGAFTGATRPRKGFLEVVAGGTLFLDEIGEISPKMQVDLLRVLEEKKIIPIGAREPIEVDFRLISATRRNLEKEIAENRYREDFYYRINVITIDIPPLRDRKEDIPLLVQHFLNKYSRETTKRVDHISRGALQVLKNYDWPGNVRELENAIERAVVLCRSRSLDVDDFAFVRPSAASASLPKNLSLREMEKQYILRTLEENDWNITRTAGVLEINRVTLHKKIKNLKLRPART